MPNEVEALRTSLDSRLTALEKALADPRQHGLLESLIMDLARVATQEADATARQAVLNAQTAAQKAIEAAAAQSAQALEKEKAESAALRQVVENAKNALKQAEAALKEERRATEAARQEAAAATRELASLRQSVEQEQSARATQQRELVAALAAAEAERARASALEQQVAQAHAQGEAERAALASEAEKQRAAAETVRAAAAQMVLTKSALERDLGAARAEVATLRQGAETALRALDAARGELDGTKRELESTRGERDSARRDLDGLRRELDGVRHDSEARSQTLSHSQAEQERALRTAQDAARAAEGRIEQAVRERDTARQEADALKRQLATAEETIREREAHARELQAAHEARDAAELLNASRKAAPEAELDLDSETVVDLTTMTKDEELQLAMENRIRALELALRDAETRAESAELELDEQRKSTGRAPVARTAPAQTPAAPAAPPPTEQFRGVRAAKRVPFKGETDIQIDGTPGKLVDLSLTGAQLLTPSAMKPNRLIKVSLPMGDTIINCKAKVAWARLEPRAGQIWYRAGVSFTSVDESALEAFLAAYEK